MELSRGYWVTYSAKEQVQIYYLLGIEWCQNQRREYITELRFAARPASRALLAGLALGGATLDLCVRRADFIKLFVYLSIKSFVTVIMGEVRLLEAISFFRSIS